MKLLSGHYYYYYGQSLRAFQIHDFQCCSYVYKDIQNTKLLFNQTLNIAHNFLNCHTSRTQATVLQHHDMNEQ
jgi:hypothetical protein